ncbi:MAG TPA: glycosyltransferase, partial [Allocoleopsis sp.]
TTVSPHHAWEARHGDFGYGLGNTLYTYQHKFGGILNGIDYNVWNPQIDPYIPFQYSAENWEEKAKNKKALRERLWLSHGDKPIIAYIGRLDDQKGVHLVHHGIYYALHRQCQFVLLGLGTEPGINHWFGHEKYHLNNNPDVHIEIGFNEELSHLIYAGSDIIIVPSNYEPCGLTQMIGLRYGTVPIVRGVGGLVNTVFDRDYDENHPKAERNGYVFYQTDNSALESAMDRAIGLWYKYPQEFRQLSIQGMEYDYSWNHPGRDYLEIYNLIRHK